MGTPSDAAVLQGWAHTLNMGTGQYRDDYAHNTSQGAPVYTYAQTGQSNQWWWVANNDGSTVTFSSYETQQSGGLGAWWYRNLTRDSGNRGVLGPQRRWGAGIGFGTLPGEERRWYADGDAGTYIHSNAWNGDCLTAHAGAGDDRGLPRWCRQHAWAGSARLRLAHWRPSQVPFRHWADHVGVQITGPVDIRRMRKSVKAEKAVATGGAIATIADDHHQETFRGHYAQGTTLRVISGRVIAQAQQHWLDQAGTGPVVLAPTPSTCCTTTDPGRTRPGLRTRRPSATGPPVRLAPAQFAARWGRSWRNLQAVLADLHLAAADRAVGPGGGEQPRGRQQANGDVELRSCSPGRGGRAFRRPRVSGR
ncbi:hypothetical protein ACFVVA_34705 [Kitasatospora sp. NPDC058048]|uniref:hypothetical protein n=1 Tax=Kitasatospora sp. NPDC058048 TaxID=3346313 RepID=UPI0036DC7EEA